MVHKFSRQNTIQNSQTRIAGKEPFMAKKLNRARRRAMGVAITSREGCWIQYQLNLRNITQKTVAEKAGCSMVSVSQFLNGRKNSPRTKAALVELLGYSDFSVLIAAARARMS